MRRKASDSSLAKLIGENVARWRLIRGMSQKELGDACDEPVTSQQMSKFELGINRISSTQLVAFAKALEVPITSLISGAKDFLPTEELSEQSYKDGAMMKSYKKLPPSLQSSFKVMIEAMALELSNKQRSIPHGK